MYKPELPTILRCPKCDTTVNVNWRMILTNPPRYEWTCPNCGEKGVVYENQISGDFSPTNATINAIPSVYSTAAKCEICGEEFKYDAKHMHICPKCRDAVAKLRAPVIKSAEVADSKPTACDIPGKPFLQQGWECPKCGAILAPHQHYCPFCSPSEYGRTNWLGTTYGEWTNKDNLTPPTGQYTNPNPSTTISKVTQ